MSKKSSKQKREDIICTFNISRSNVKFEDIGDGILSNFKIFDFDEDEDRVDVDVERREFLCIGNQNKEPIKVSIKVKNVFDKYSIKLHPCSDIIIKKGEACEIAVTLILHCSATVDNILIVTVQSAKTEKEICTKLIPIKCSRIAPNTRLPYVELKDQKQLCEGLFGTYFKAQYKTNIVAIKKMKQMDNDDKIREFVKELEYRQGIRNDFLLFYFGSVTIPGKHCIVSEFAEFGSLVDVMKKHKDDPLSVKLRTKFMLDCSRGLKALHDCQVEHKNIKPENVLIINMTEDMKINAKLSDFGSNRNVNMLVTSVTFNNQQGCPKYMAPEFIKESKYELPTDIFAFAVVMLECFIWGDAYPKSLFANIWDLPEFIASGKRREKPNEIEKKQWDLVTNCWKQNMDERLKIDYVVKQLENLYAETFIPH